MGGYTKWFRGSERQGVAQSEAELILTALQRSGVSKARPQDVAFYLSAHKAGKLNYRDIRKMGTPLDTTARRDRAISGRSILTHEFLATLNDAGLANPARAAELIATPAAHLISSAAQLQRDLKADIKAWLFHPSNMAAGPCNRAAATAGRRLNRAELKPVPFAECCHPDQCACRYQAAE